MAGKTVSRKGGSPTGSAQMNFPFTPGNTPGPRMIPPDPAIPAAGGPGMKKRTKKKVRPTPKKPPPTARRKKRSPSARQDPAPTPTRTRKRRPPGYATAESMSKAQREISVSEFFAKNRHLLGFDNKRKALLTTVKAYLQFYWLLLHRSLHRFFSNPVCRGFHLPWTFHHPWPF